MRRRHFRRNRCAAGPGISPQHRPARLPPELLDELRIRRIRGERPEYPQHAAESFPPADAPLDAELWDRFRRDMAWCIAEFTGLAQLPSDELNRPIESAHQGDRNVAGTLEAVITQITAHNSYHTGQIVLIRQVLKAWPPKAGGDTW